MTIVDNSNPSSPIRGAIRTSVSTSTENLVAGQNFSVFVTIQNPFEVPLVVHRVSAHLPTEFIDVDQRARARYAELLKRSIIEIEAAGNDYGLAPTLLPKAKKTWLDRILQQGVSASVAGIGVSLASEGSRTAVAKDLSTSSVSETTIDFSLPLLGSIRQTFRREREGALNIEEAKQLKREQLERERARYLVELQSLDRETTTSTVLQAGNSTTRVFTLCSRQRTWFRPSSYRFQIGVEYELAGLHNVDTIDHQLQVKASLQSILLGSLLGGAGGWLVRRQVPITMTATDWVGLGVSLVLAAMTVVLFARKKDVQPLIAVEDFWGGIAIGFLVTYSGTEMLESITEAPKPSG
jgi:hypothetical protein